MRHRFHSLCPYFAMFPESFAETWIGRVSRPGDVVLDPFCGRGTTPFQAMLMGRRPIACDVNDVAYCLTKAKTLSPSLPKVMTRLRDLEERFDGRSWRYVSESASPFFQMAFFRNVLQQLLYLRAVLRWRTSRTDAMIAAIALGSLHGEMDKSSAYLSNQMPRTISTKPDYSVRYWKTHRLMPPERNVFSTLRQNASFRYLTPPPSGDAVVIHGDMRHLPDDERVVRSKVRCVVTSPPYLDVTNFEEDQWLRLWLLGGPAYPRSGRLSKDDRHTSLLRYWDFIGDMWFVLGQVVATKGHVIIRIGSGRLDPVELRAGLAVAMKRSNRKVGLVSWEVSAMRNKQSDRFRPGAKGCTVEVDCHFQFRN